jgi:[ribosomal protein S5]-alanine N-acetyltransferase
VILQPVDRVARDAALSGDLAGRAAAPGWPHEDSAPGLSFLDAGGLGFLVIDADDRVAGECGSKAPPDADGVVEIGYGLAAPSRGHGLGGAAVAALVSELAALPDVRIIEAEVFVGNEPSWRLLERLGFELTGQDRRELRRYRLPLRHLH